MSAALPDRVRAYVARHPSISLATAAYACGARNAYDVRRILSRKSRSLRVISGADAQRVEGLREQGASYGQIAKHVGCHKDTVRRYFARQARGQR